MAYGTSIVLRVLAALVVLTPGSSAQGQTDTSRPRPVLRVHAPAPASGHPRLDSLNALVRAATGDRMDPALRRRMADTLAAQRQLWEQRRPTSYLIRVLDMSGCIDVRIRPRAGGRLLREQLVVRDTTVVSRAGVPIPAAYEQRCPLPWRVDDLFADVARALADTTASVGRVDYDAAYGFPRAYWLVRGESPHGGSAVLVESFGAEQPER